MKMQDSGKEKRIRDVMSDPHNDLISRVEDAGKHEDGTIVMHNGLKIYDDSYFPELIIPMLVQNKGCHEPQEEFWFQHLLSQVQDDGVIIELGSYWAFYSMWFLHGFPDRRAFMVEPSEENMECGVRNFDLNDLSGVFILGKCPSTVGVPQLMADHDLDVVDMLHIDIQGSELEVLKECVDVLKEGRVHRIVLGTHGVEVHHECAKLLRNAGFFLMANTPPSYSLCCDGVIVAVIKKPSRDVDLCETYSANWENMNEASRLHVLGDNYYNGRNGAEKDDSKAFEYWLRAAVLGSEQACRNVSWAYSAGIGCEVDEAEYQKWTARIEKMRKPNFLIIGAQKSGTTWLRKMLQSHSEVWAENEEAHYFDGPDYETRNEEEYLSKFDARTEKMVGEKTPRYMCEPEVMERIFDFNPDVKLIMLLRNPTNRAYSQWRMETRMAIRKGLAELSFTDWVEDNSQLIPNLRPINRGFYIRQIENILSYFPREQLRIEIFERMGQDGYNRICDFMGIEHQPVASSFSQNNYPDMDSDLRVSMDSQFSPFNDELRTFLSDELEEWS